MLPALLTSCLWAFSMFFAGRSTRIFGSMTANLLRMSVALALLAIWAHSFGEGVRGASLGWFVVSGAVGFGLGDIALFVAIERIGPRLTVILAQCLAAPIAALTERAWLGTHLTPAQWLWMLLILFGVALALWPDRRLHIERRAFWLGIVAGIIAALGQAWGAVISRKGSLLADATGLPIDGGTAAYQRMLGGIVVTAAFALLLWHFRKSKRADDLSNAASFSQTAQQPQKPIVPHAAFRERFRRGWKWAALNALVGPALGVGCYQWALATTPSGIVQSIVAITPILTIPLTAIFDGDRPRLHSILGGIIAVAGTIGLIR